MAKEREWPRQTYNADARFLTPDGFRKFERPLVGPLRFGTEPGIGPRGNAVALGKSEDRSDMGMDRVSPREFDPMGTSTSRYRPNAESDLISRQKRGAG